MSSQQTIAERLGMLGIHCDDVPADRLTSATTALACFPMYMVANVHGWTKETQWELPLLDIPGWEAIREAFAIGRQEKVLHLAPEHRHALGAMLGKARPADRIIYEYALDTLAMYLAQAAADVAAGVRAAVARTIIAVARASGEGLFGTGEKINRHEFELIQQIAERLDLASAPEAKTLLDGLND
jgi:hypothetical protein